ncbi:MAG: family 1 glycosylhydrolase [Oscillospiraceae bacterium]|nr:family 1 glycosylhydrolase [Oscillospiraceae bacterium]
MNYQFPRGFLWGVATAAAQIEGAPYEDGRGPSIWDVFCKIPGKIPNDGTPDIACDSYHRLEEDIAILKQLGVKSYRFSFSWSRIIPDGKGEVNPAGLAYYRRLIDLLNENGIVPNATIYHWDLPYALQIQGGFGNREIVGWYTRYAEILLDNFGRDVPIWVTFNEPIATYVGHAQGFFAPGLLDEKYARQCIHHLLLCHGAAVKLFRRKHLENAQIGIVVDVWKHFPAHSGDPADEALAEYNNECTGYGMFLHPLFLGGYSDVLTRYMTEHDLTPKMESGDFAEICQPLDFYGLNFYNGLIDDAAAEQEKAKAGGNFQDRPENHTEKLYEVLHMLAEDYRISIPIYITENGVPQTDSPDVAALLDDQERIDYTAGVLAALHRAMADGIDVRGYYHWSLMDNFEWSAGFEARYGLYYTDYSTLERIPKKSAAWYTDLIRNNGFSN